MLISELEAKLKALREAHGDLNIQMGNLEIADFLIGPGSVPLVRMIGCKSDYFWSQSNDEMKMGLLADFAVGLINSHETPVEFHKILKERFWDLIAE